MTLTHTAQSSSAPLAHGSSLLSPDPGHQTLSVSVTLPATAADLLSLEDRITASLVWSTSRRVSVMTRRLQRYEHLIDNDGDKIAEFENLYKAARFDVANTEYQSWLLYKQQSSDAFDRILEKRIPKNCH